MPPVLWGCKPAAKIRTKCVVRLIMGPEIGWKKNRPKSGLNDPELIEQKISKTWILSFGPKSHSRNVPPEICLFFFVPNLGCEVHFVLSQPAARFVPPEIG